MKKTILGIAILMLVGSSSMAMNYKQAQESGKPILLYFSMFGCGACKEFSPSFDKAEKKYSQKFAFAKEDASSEMSRKLKITSVPSVFIIDSKENKTQEISWDCLQSMQCFEKTLSNY